MRSVALFLLLLLKRASSEELKIPAIDPDTCTKHADCPLHKYCYRSTEGEQSCYKCGYLVSHECDAFDNDCCSQDFLSRCVDIPPLPKCKNEKNNVEPQAGMTGEQTSINETDPGSPEYQGDSNTNTLLNKTYTQTPSASLVSASPPNSSSSSLPLIISPSPTVNTKSLPASVSPSVSPTFAPKDFQTSNAPASVNDVASAGASTPGTFAVLDSTATNTTLLDATTVPLANKTAAPTLVATPVSPSAMIASNVTQSGGDSEKADTITVESPDRNPQKDCRCLNCADNAPAEKALECAEKDKCISDSGACYGVGGNGRGTCYCQTGGWNVPPGEKMPGDVPTADPFTSPSTVPHAPTPSASPSGAGDSIQCNSHSDCPTTRYCDYSYGCYGCHFVDKDQDYECDAVDGNCCSTEFLTNCPSNPQKCSKEAESMPGDQKLHNQDEFSLQPTPVSRYGEDENNLIFAPTLQVNSPGLAVVTNSPTTFTRPMLDGTSSVTGTPSSDQQTPSRVTEMPNAKEDANSIELIDSKWMEEQNTHFKQWFNTLPWWMVLSIVLGIMVAGILIFCFCQYCCRTHGMCWLCNLKSICCGPRQKRNARPTRAERQDYAQVQKEESESESALELSSMEGGGASGWGIDINRQPDTTSLAISNTSSLSNPSSLQAYISEVRSNAHIARSSSMSAESKVLCAHAHPHNTSGKRTHMSILVRSCTGLGTC